MKVISLILGLVLCAGCSSSTRDMRAGERVRRAQQYGEILLEDDTFKQRVALVVREEEALAEKGLREGVTSRDVKVGGGGAVGGAVAAMLMRAAVDLMARKSNG